MNTIWILNFMRITGIYLFYSSKYNEHLIFQINNVCNSTQYLALMKVFSFITFHFLTSDYNKLQRSGKCLCAIFCWNLVLKNYPEFGGIKMSYSACSLNVKCQGFLLWGLNHVWMLEIVFCYSTSYIFTAVVATPKNMWRQTNGSYFS